MLIIATHGADEGALRTLGVEANKIETLSLVLFIKSAWLIFDAVLRLRGRDHTLQIIITIKDFLILFCCILFSTFQKIISLFNSSLIRDSPSPNCFMRLAVLYDDPNPISGSDVRVDLDVPELYGHLRLPYAHF